MPNLRCILNVESNLINNMPYEILFARGIHVVTTGQVFAEPVAEMGLAMALNIARGIVDADVDFREGHELYETLKERGVDFIDEPHLIARMPDHDLWMVFFRDSEGNMLGLMSEVRR